MSKPKNCIAGAIKKPGALITAPDTGTANAYAMALTPPIAAYTPGMLLSLRDSYPDHDSY